MVGCGCVPTWTSFSTSISSCVFPFSFTIVDNPKPPTLRLGIKGAPFLIGY